MFSLFFVITHQSFASPQQNNAEVARLQSYLDSIGTLYARFDQTNPDGSQSSGQIWLDRPGRVRIQYDPPTPFLIVANKNLLTFYDSKLGQTSNIPTDQTPIGILLDKPVQFDRLQTNSVQTNGEQSSVNLSRRAKPGEGSIEIKFNLNPLGLIGWTTFGVQKEKTQIVLKQIKTGDKFNSDLFYFVDPNFFKNNGG